MTIRTQSLLALCVLAAALALGGVIAIPAAHAAPKPPTTPPTTLWKSYPLEQRPRGVVPRLARQDLVQAREASRQAAPQGSRLFENFLLASLLSATVLAIATIVLLRSSVPVRVGGSLRGRVLARSPRPLRGPKNTAAKRKRRPPLREVTAELVAEPEVPPAEIAEPEPRRQQETELLEALQPNTQPKPRRAQPKPEPVEPVLEPQLRELIRPKHAAPAPAHPALEREIEALHEQIKARSAEAPEPEAAQAGLVCCEIRLWHGFVRCQLYAALVGSDEAFALSPFFRLRDDLAPNQQAKQALAALVAELEEGGWAVVSEGRPWYRHTLELLPPEYE
jgi:hypothetical protein